MKTDQGSVSLEWLPAKETVKTPIDGYIVEMSTGDNSKFVVVGKVDGMACNFTAKGLEDGQKCNFRVKAENQVGCSAGVQLEKAVTATAVGKISFRLSSRVAKNVQATFTYLALCGIPSFCGKLFYEVRVVEAS